MIINKQRPTTMYKNNGRDVHSQSASLLANEWSALCTVRLSRKADCEEQRCKINRIIQNTQILLPLQRTPLGARLRQQNTK